MHVPSVCPAPLLEAEIEIATSTGRTVYDSLYVALAVQLQGRVVTADETLYNSLKNGPLAPHILWIQDDFVVPAIAEDIGS